MNIRVLLPGLLCLAFLCACASGRVEKVDFNPLIDVPQNTKSAPADLRQIKLDIPVGAHVGVSSRGSRGCGWPYVPTTRDAIQKAFDRESLRDNFDHRMEALGYDIVGGPQIIFDDEQRDEILRTEYLVGARIKSVQVDICQKDIYTIYLLLATTPGLEGELKMTVEWTVYDRLRQKTVYRTQTKGYAKRTLPNMEGMALLMNDAFAMASHNLGTTSEFRDVLYFEKTPDVLEKQMEQDKRIRPRFFESEETVTIRKRPVSNQKLEERVDTIRKSVVLVQAGDGHGSGFFVSGQGHILTNAHVVGDALRVRVETSGKEHALIAEVLRRDTQRDIALLKLKKVPADLFVPELPFRLDWPAISEEVFVVGAPRLKDLSETITKGIVSAHRKGFKIGRNQNFIQADVTIHGGNSGGPMLDKNGNITGIAVSMFDPTGLKIDTGLNLFIPIREALERLNVNLTENFDAPEIDNAPLKQKHDKRPYTLIPPASGGEAFLPRGLRIQYHTPVLRSPSRPTLYQEVSATLDD